MTILKGDVKLVKSEVMDDVPEGGGGPTVNLVADGSSNAVFPDVSETDRAAGRVSARKLHVWVQSNDVDTYLGAGVIVAEPPNDPNVSVTLMTLGETFDRRTDAINRIEAYLFTGANYPGFLYGNHIEGQKTLSIYQRTADLPGIGTSLTLTKREGFSDEFVQYVRVTDAAIVLRTATDINGDYLRYEMTLKISDPLRADFPGLDMARIDPTKTALAAATKISNVITADAAKYYGCQPLVEVAAINDFSVLAAGIFSQLVPSAQIETPIGDARSNQILTGVVGGGATVVRSVQIAFSTSQNMFIGGSVKPGTLTITRAGLTLTDNGGRLMNGGLQVGLVDYENGIVQLLSNAFAPDLATYAVTYQAAGVPDAVSQSQGLPVTIESRSISYVRTIEPPPVPGTLSVSYMFASRWYTIRDDGSGALRGPDSGYGAGTLNPTSGTVAVTLGALPDVGSEVIYQWVEPRAARDAEQLVLDNDGRLYWAFNTAGVSSLEPGPKAITAGGLVITWLDTNVIPTATRTVTDDGAGNLTGYGTGTVNYAKGTLRLSPTTLPAPGTQINVNLGSSITPIPFTGVAVSAGVGSYGAANVTPGSIQMALVGQLKGVRVGGPVVNWGAPRTWPVRDDGSGGLFIDLYGYRIACGTVNYSAGTFAISQSPLSVPPLCAMLLAAWDNVYLYEAGPIMFTIATS